MLSLLILIILLSVIIFLAGELFEKASSDFGDHLGISQSVKGATIEAVASSTPEILFVGFSLIAYGSFELGLGSIAGASLFHLLVVPAVVLFVTRSSSISVSKEVVTRDLRWFVFSKLLLLLIIFFSPIWNWRVGFLFLATYIIYWMVVWSKEKSRVVSDPSWSLSRVVFLGVTSLLVLIFSTYMLVDYILTFATLTNISPMVLSFTFIALIMSLPELYMAVFHARKHGFDDLMSTTFGSNTFDVCVGLGLPVLIATLTLSPFVLVPDHIELVFFTLLASFLVLSLFKKYVYYRWMAILSLVMYVAIMLYGILV